MIKIENLKLQFGSAFCLSVNELSLPDSGLFVIEGKNGSGKSTFLEVFAGRIKPESLSLVVDEKTLMNKELFQYVCYRFQYKTENKNFCLSDFSTIIEAELIMEDLIYD